MTKDAQHNAMPDRAPLIKPLIKIEGLHLQRGVRDVIQHLNIDVEVGSALVIRGANGSGKTTLLRAMAGLLTPTAGNITINGISMDQDRMTVMSSLIYIGHRDGGASHLTASENLKFWADTRQDTGTTHTAIKDALATFGMDGHADTPLYMMSEGQRKRCGLARLSLAVNSSADNNDQHPGMIWLLDEPLTALDTASGHALTELLNKFTNAGGTAVIATHQVMELAHIKVMDLAEADQ